ncbi:MAG: diguanylate cyclase, partial [Candidatus Omnitrophica bacterium]|nr:diguanylate cyclase [Candidatus Omnitrophota bacterium]
AMIAGLCWARWAVACLSGAAILAVLTSAAPSGPQPLAWLQMAAIGATPWLLAMQRATHERLVKQTQAAEAVRLNRLQGLLQELSELQAWLRQMEAQIARITDLYRVTKGTSRALHVGELFGFSLDLVPRLLNVKGLRLIDLSQPITPPPVLRARRVPDGRLLPEPTNHLLPVEQSVLSRTAQTGSPSSGTTQDLGCEFPAGVSRVTWAPLWSEQKPLGVLIADDLPPDQLETLSIVANQLALQLARVHLYQQVEALAVTDTLTGLFVRRYFLELASEELARTTRHGLACAFLMADLDHFKSKNDTYGHLVGDVILREVAQLLHKNLRGIDLIARYGGEELILLLIETDPEQALPIAERLRQLVEVQPIRAYDETLTQTVSIGVACYPQDGREIQALIDHADQALYAAKRAGRNRVVRWSPNSSRLKVEGSRGETGHLEPRT